MGEPHPAWRWSHALPLLPAIVVILVWWTTVGYGFQFDDWNVIVDNPAVHGIAAWWQSQPGIRPLLKLGYAVNYHLGTAPDGFRAVNILIHAVATSLVTLLGARRLVLWGVPCRQAAVWALAAGLVFALHPAQTEAVTYISGRSSSLAALFALAGLYAWDRGLRPGARRAWPALACLFAICAAATKETALVLPLAFWLWSAGDARVPVPGRRLMAPAAVFAVASAALLASYAGLLRFSLDIRPAGENLLAQVTAIPVLLSHVVWLGGINIDPPVPDSTLLRLGCAGFWLTVAVLLVTRYPGRNVVRFGVLWTLLWLAPTNSIVPRLDPINDRHLYMPLAGLAWTFAWLGWQAWRRARVAAVAMVICVGVVLAAATAERNLDYRSEVSLWRRTAAQNPHSARAANNLGFALASRCAWAEAEAQFRRAIALDPAQIEASANLSLVESGRFREFHPVDCAGP